MRAAPNISAAALAVIPGGAAAQDADLLKSERQRVRLAEIDGTGETRAVPDIPLLCVATR
ncbi:hypothetical protein OCH239_02880 [Roseivivax halodurans JCM 10272]|uniref:Uncharacterized protein n=1 Tax=Roseivivax halodurans JCM 10272 TaxID=1449350 RepID=X7EEQ9_9RHOB|nr:hypothetical protein OCH239_02880 [Roseivivax halodurans JCM 10272]